MKNLAQVSVTCMDGNSSGLLILDTLDPQPAKIFLTIVLCRSWAYLCVSDHHRSELRLSSLCWACLCVWLFTINKQLVNNAQIMNSELDVNTVFTPYVNKLC